MDMNAIRGLPLPSGFGFHPTDIELCHYLRRKIIGLPIEHDIIPDLDIYKYEPWDLSAKSPPLLSLCSNSNSNSKLHFFTLGPEYPKGHYASRTTQAGYWKSTGPDCIIIHRNHKLCTKKTLVFQLGHTPGIETEWVMHEYSLHEDQCKVAPHLKNLYVLCRVTKRDTDYYEVPVCISDQLGADQLTPAAIQPDPIMHDNSSTRSRTIGSNSDPLSRDTV